MFAWAEAARPALAFVAFVGLHVPSLGAVGLRGHPLAFRGLLWACVGLCWPSSGAVGLCGPALPALTCIGRRWALWACIGLPWAAVDLRWPLLAVVGCCGPSWACVGLPWAFVAVVRAKEGCRGLVQPASNKDLIKRPPQLAVHAMGWACSCIKLSSSSVRK